MTDTISRSTAIDRMRDGLPCETFCREWQRDDGKSGWTATKWQHFDCENVEFRIPPEPRREAREWWIEEQDQFYAYSAPTSGHAQIHVREVLDDEVPVRRMNWYAARDEYLAWCLKRGLLSSNTGVDSWIASRSTLGLIGEGS